MKIIRTKKAASAKAKAALLWDVKGLNEPIAPSM
jgi:hypothetical protein